MRSTYQTKSFSETIYYPLSKKGLEFSTPDLQITRCGEVKCNEQFHSSHYLAHAWLLLIETGEFILEVDGVAHSLPENCAILIPAKVSHDLRLGNQCRTGHYFWIDFKGQNQLEIFADSQLKFPTVITGPFPSIQSKLDQTLHIWGHESQNPTFAISMAWQLIGELLELQQPVAHEHRLAKEIKVSLEQQFQYPVKISRIAEQLSVSRTTLYRKFSETYHQSPQDYLNHLRITQAKNLLQYSNLAITEVGFQCGFDSLQTFHYMFRKLVGESPGAWRKQMDKA